MNLDAVIRSGHRFAKTPGLRVDAGGLEALKWLGVLLMTGDHINKYLFNATLPYLFEGGRAAMPLFMFVLAYKLGQPGCAAKGVYPRVVGRLVLFGSFATVPYIALGGLVAGWWPLNIMFTLAALTVVIALLDGGGRLRVFAAAAVFAAAGAVVEFWWPALALGLSVWWYCRRPSIAPVALWVCGIGALALIGFGFWALLAALPIWCATRVRWPAPRLRLFFYAYYPAHLAALWLIRIPMGRAGYLFFT